MEEKKFYLPGILLAAAALLISFLWEGILVVLAVTIAALVVNLRKRRTHRVKIGIALTILAGVMVLSTVGIMAHQLYMNAPIYEQEGTLTKEIVSFLI